ELAGGLGDLVVELFGTGDDQGVACAVGLDRERFAATLCGPLECFEQRGTDARCRRVLKSEHADLDTPPIALFLHGLCERFDLYKCTVVRANDERPAGIVAKDEHGAFALSTL